MSYLIFTFLMGLATAESWKAGDLKVETKISPKLLKISVNKKSVEWPIKGANAKVVSVRSLSCPEKYLLVEYGEAVVGSKFQTGCQTALLVKADPIKVISDFQFSCDEEGSEDSEDASFFKKYHVALEKNSPVLREGAGKHACD